MTSKHHKQQHHNDNTGVPIITSNIMRDKPQLEPNKKSLLDTLRENLRICQRVTYIHRMIYIGEHAFENVGDHLKDAFEKIVKNVNDHYCDEKLTGYLFYHQRYFCHFIEGSEETLIKHLKLLLGTDSIKIQLGRMKLLIVYHHVNQRILDEWVTVTAKPPTLLEKINMSADLKQAMDKVRYCIEKMYGLGMALRPVDILIEEQAGEAFLAMRGSATKVDPEASRKTNLYGQIVNPIYPFLLELTILEFLLTTSYTQDLRKYFEIYGDVPYLDAYEELVWPVPCDFVPMNVFEQELDPITNLTIHIPQ